MSHWFKSVSLVQVRLLSPSTRESLVKFTKQNFVENVLRQFRTQHLDVNWPLGALLLGNLITNVSPIMAAGSSPPLVRVRLLCPSIRECTVKLFKQNFVENVLRQFRTHHLDVNWTLGP
jgi:hypothetical protein